MIVEYMIQNNVPIIHVFWTDEKGVRHHEIDEEFEPYFYVDYDEVIKADARIKRIEDGDYNSKMFYYSIFGKKVKKIVTYLPSDVRDLREKFTRSYEDDILFPTRYTIDKIDKIKGILRVATIDIEVNDNSGMPKWEKADKEIVSCVVHDSFTEKYYVLYWRVDLDNKISEIDNTVYISKNSEEGFLSEFTALINRINQDMITAWNVSFDVRYLISRMRKLKMNPELLSPLYYVDEQRDKISGRIIYDSYSGYKKFIGKELRSFKLEYIASLELGKTKIPRESIYELWQNDIDKLIEYNKRDVELVVEINRKNNIIGLYDEVRRITKVDFGRVLMYSSSVDCALLAYCKDKFILPGHRKRLKKKKFEGAIVVQPQVGVHKNIAVLDLTRSYPSAMISCNISPETKSKTGDIVINDKLRFKSQPQGVIPSILGDMIKLRDEKKKLMRQYVYGSEQYNVYYTQQFALKSITNTFYGAIGYRDFRLYDSEVASAVTEVGRNLIKWCMNVVKSKGYEVLYCDTDSIFIPLKNKELEKQVEEGFKIKNMIVDTLDGFAKTMNVKEHSFDIDFDKIFSSVLFVTKKHKKDGKVESAKKKYNGKLVWSGGKKVDEIDTKGFESIRSDTSELGKKIQNDLFRIIHSDKKLRTVKDEVFEYLNAEIQKVRGGVYSLEYISQPASIGKQIDEYKVETMTLKAAKNAMFINKEYKPGDKPLMLYVKKVPNRFPPMDCILFDEDKDIPRGMLPDYDKIIDKSIINNIENILEAIGINYEEVITGKKQTQLWEKGF